MANKRVSVIGAGSCPAEVFDKARELGRLLAESGWTVVCGGLGGVMEGVCLGARDAGGATIGILPGDDPEQANPYVNIPIATGIGQMRNALVVLNGQAAVAVEGGFGTLSEVGLALKARRPVVALGTWSKLNGVKKADSPTQAVEMLDEIFKNQKPSTL